MLYKILDMLAVCSVKVIFLATTMRFDIVDSFEKRIKSRFSHRTEALYEQSLELFTNQVKSLLQSKIRVLQDDVRDSEELKDDVWINCCIEKIKEFLESGLTHDILITAFNNGQ